MNNSEHIHRFSLSAWLFNFLLSFFFLFLSVSVLVIKVPQIPFGEPGFFDYVAIAFIILLLPLGLALLLFPFVTKIVVKASGLEYHSATLILRTDWKDLVSVGYRENTPAGKTLVVVAQGGKVELRNWTTPFRNILVKQPQGIEILVSQFGAANGHSFESDILVNVSQHAELSNEIESLQ